MRPGEKTQPFHAAAQKSALQNFVPGFSLKASPNNIFMHMLKKQGQINTNWLSSLTSKAMSRFGLLF